MMDFLNINLNLLKSFLAVYKTGGIIKAAKLLEQTPPTISYNIKQLEKQLDKKLFITHKKGADPTPDAKAIFPLVETAFENLVRCNEKLNLNPKGSLRVGTHDIVFEHFMIDFFCKFQKDFPDILPEFHYNTKNDFFAELDENRIDVAVMWLYKRPPSHIKTFEVVSYTSTFYANRKFAETHGIAGEITFAQFTALPFIMFSKSNATLARLETALGEKLEVAQITPSEIMTYNMVMNGQGVGLSFDKVLDARKNNRIIKLKIKDRPSPPPVVIECACNRKTSALVTLFVKELKRFYSLG